MRASDVTVNVEFQWVYCPSGKTKWKAACGGMELVVVKSTLKISVLATMFVIRITATLLMLFGAKVTVCVVLWVRVQRLGEQLTIPFGFRYLLQN